MPSKTPLKTELDILAALESGEVVTQMTLAKRVGVAVGLINALIKRGMRKGYVKARSAPYKRYAYYLTPKGFAEKSRLVALYLENALDFFREARREYAELFERARLSGVRRLVLVGGGELAEIAGIAATDLDIELVGLVDPEANQPRRHALPVLASIAEIDAADAAVITDARAPEATYAAVCAAHPDLPVLAPAQWCSRSVRTGCRAAPASAG